MRSTYSFFLAIVFSATAAFCISGDWERVNGLDDKYISVLCANGSILYAGTRDSGVFKSDVDGIGWFAVNIGLTSLKVQALAASGSNLFAGTADGGVFRTEDSGISWEAMNTGISTLNIQALATNDTFLFAGTNGGGVCRSSDSGMHWFEVNFGLVFNNIYSIGINQSYVFVGTWGGSAFRSADNGLNWFLVTNGLLDPRDNIIPNCFTMSDTFIFTGTGGCGVFRAKDSARVWFPKNDGLPDSAWVSALAQSGAYLFAATQAGVFCSVDNGDKWSEFSSGLTDTIVNSFAIIGTNIFAGTRNGVWRHPMGPGTESERVRKRLLNSVTLDQNFPNPFNSTTILRYNVPVNNFVSLKVYDTNGKEVAILANEIKSPSMGSALFDASSLANGLYFCRLRAGGFDKTKVMLLIR